MQDSREEPLQETQPTEDESPRKELESLKAKLLEMQQSYDESQRTVAELRAYIASLQSDQQQAQETLGLEKLKLSEAATARETTEEQHKSAVDERDAAPAKEQSSHTAEANTQPAEESRHKSPSGEWPSGMAELQKALNLPIWDEGRKRKEQAKQNLDYAQRLHDEWMPKLEAERKENKKRMEELKKQEQEMLEFEADAQFMTAASQKRMAGFKERIARCDRRLQERQAKNPSASVESPSNAERQANEGDFTGPEGSPLNIQREEQHQPTAVPRQDEAVDDDQISRDLERIAIDNRNETEVDGEEHAQSRRQSQQRAPRSVDEPLTVDDT